MTKTRLDEDATATVDDALRKAIESDAVGKHPVLSRLLREVANANEMDVPFRYDRVHNRHNRS